MAQRTIIRPGSFSPPNAAPADDWKNSLLKMLPAEVVGAYITIDGLLKGAGLGIAKSTLDPSGKIYFQTTLAVSITLFVLNYFYLKSSISPVAKKQFWLSVFAFPVWLFTLGGPFLCLDAPEPLIHLFGSILAILYTVVSVVLVRK